MREWRVVGGRVEVTSEIGTDTALLGPLASAPASVAREKLAEMAKAAKRSARPRADTVRFNIRMLEVAALSTSPACSG